MKKRLGTGFTRRSSQSVLSLRTTRSCSTSLGTARRSNLTEIGSASLYLMARAATRSSNLRRLIHIGRQDADGETPEDEFDGSTSRSKEAPTPRSRPLIRRTKPLPRRMLRIRMCLGVQCAAGTHDPRSRVAVRTVRPRRLAPPETQQIGARHVVLILDSCFSGTAELRTGTSRVRGVANQRALVSACCATAHASS